MGFWAEIKSVLNSTIGTSEFKSLDELILLGKELVISEDELLNLSGKTNPSFTVYYNGYIKIQIDEPNPSEYEDGEEDGDKYSEWYLEVYKNGIIEDTSSGFEATYVGFDVAVNRGDVIMIKRYTDIEADASIPSGKVLGKVVSHYGLQEVDNE